MSTRSNIIVVHPDGTIKGIYCHSDGYPSWNGRLLLRHHNSEEAAQKIISLGDCSSLNEKLEPEPGQARQSNVSMFYHRDRNEELYIETLHSIEGLNRYGDATGSE